MRPGDVELRCGDVADAAFGEQLRRGLIEQFLEYPVVLVDLGVEVLDASGQGSQRCSGAALSDVGIRAVAELSARGDLLSGAPAA
jgi:hypothetical protein